MKSHHYFIFTLLLLLLMGTHPLSQEVRADTSDDIESTDEFINEDETDLSGFGEQESSDFGESVGFDEVKVDLDQVNPIEVEESSVFFGGFFKEEVDYSYAYKDPKKPDFSKLKTTLNLNLDVKFNKNWQAQVNWNGFYDYSYTYRGRDNFSDETLETYESESEFREVYLDGGLTKWLRVKIGRQIIAWGQSDTAQVTDMANPRDLRELGMVDLEDARIPVGATKLSFLFGTLELNAVAIHEIRSNKSPSAGSEFDFLQDIRSTGVIIEDEELPESNTKNTEYLARLFKTFNGGDFGLMWADVYDDYAHIEFKKLIILNALTTKPTAALTVIPRHKRIKTYGFSGNLVSGSWLFKTEFAHNLGVALVRNDISTQLKNTVALTAGNGQSSAIYNEDSEIIKTWVEKNTTSGMLGVEYSGFQDITISLEAVGEKIEDYEEIISTSEYTGQLALIATYTALNDTFDAQLFWIHFTEENGDVYRVNVGYDLIDALNISGGFIAYEASKEDATVYNYRNNDRVFASLKYSF